MKAIETKYKGYLFRSRLEARWAVFFDTLGIEYSYEYEGYEMTCGIRYLPDFYLPEQGCFIEIKGPRLSKSERAAAWDKTLGFFHHIWEMVADGLGPNIEDLPKVYVFYGDIPWPYPEEGNAIEADGTEGGTEGFCWQQCPTCLKIDVARINEIFCSECPNRISNLLRKEIETLWGASNREPDPSLDPSLDVVPSLMNEEIFKHGHKAPSLRKAYAAARSARFEGGRRHLRPV